MNNPYRAESPTVRFHSQTPAPRSGTHPRVETVLRLPAWESWQIQKPARKLRLRLALQERATCALDPWLPSLGALMRRALLRQVYCKFLAERTGPRPEHRLNLERIVLVRARPML